MPRTRYGAFVKLQIVENKFCRKPLFRIVEFVTRLKRSVQRTSVAREYKYIMYTTSNDYATRWSFSLTVFLYLARFSYSYSQRRQPPVPFKRYVYACIPVRRRVHCIIRAGIHNTFTLNWLPNRTWYIHIVKWLMILLLRLSPSRRLNTRVPFGVIITGTFLRANCIFRIFSMPRRLVCVF